MCGASLDVAEFDQVWWSYKSSQALRDYQQLFARFYAEADSRYVRQMVSPKLCNLGRLKIPKPVLSAGGKE